jgi:hypothetical protein
LKSFGPTNSGIQAFAGLDVDVEKILVEGYGKRPDFFGGGRYQAFQHQVQVTQGVDQAPFHAFFEQQQGTDVSQEFLFSQILRQAAKHGSGF